MLVWNRRIIPLFRLPAQPVNITGEIDPNEPQKTDHGKKSNHA
jgi:hypothetical protein